jgi:hypothetical protein
MRIWWYTKAKITLDLTMYPGIYREFHLSLAPAGQEIYVRLQHSTTGQEAVFKLQADAGSPERWVEEQIIRQFPTSATAAELRAHYGLTRHAFKAGWSQGFGDRVYTALLQPRPTKGMRFWAELIPTLPPILYSTMNLRAVEWLGRLGPEFDLRSASKSLHDAWLAVLREARGINLKVSGLERLALDLHGWPTELLQNMALLDYSRLKEKALFARLALDYLSDEDWSAILTPMLELAPQAPTSPSKES